MVKILMPRNVNARCTSEWEVSERDRAEVEAEGGEGTRGARREVARFDV